MILEQSFVPSDSECVCYSVPCNYSHSRIGSGVVCLDRCNFIFAGVEFLLVYQKTPDNASQPSRTTKWSCQVTLVGQGCGKLNPIERGCGLGQPLHRAALYPVFWSHQNNVRRLNEQGTHILVTAFGYTTKNRFLFHPYYIGAEQGQSSYPTLFK